MGGQSDCIEVARVRIVPLLTQDTILAPKLDMLDFRLAEVELMVDDMLYRPFSQSDMKAQV